MANEKSNIVDFKGNDKLLFGIFLGVITFWLFGMSLGAIIPIIQQDTSISISNISIGISITGMVSGCFIVAAGNLVDRLGSVKMSYIGFVLNIIACSILYLFSDSFSFILGRAIQGLSGAFIMPATMALVKAYYDAKGRQRALSFWSLGSWGGYGLHVIVGGFFASHIGWKYIFIASIVCSILGMLLIKGTPEHKASSDNKQKFDYTGMIIFVVAVSFLNVIILKWRDYGLTSPLILSSTAILIVLLLLFFKVETNKKNNAFIDFSLFKNSAYAGATLSNFTQNCLAGTMVIGSIYAISYLKLGAAEAGWLTIGYLVAVLLMIRVGEKIMQAVGPKKPMLWGTLITTGGVIFLLSTFFIDTGVIYLMLIGYTLFGTGKGMYATPSTDVAMACSPSDKAGVAAGVYKMASSIGAGFGVALTLMIYNSFPADSVYGVISALILNIVFCVVSILSVSLLIPNKIKEY